MESATNKRYSGRFFSTQEIEQIRRLVDTLPPLNCQQLSYRVCEQLDRRKSDGSLKGMSCRVALLRMPREGLIVLPAPRHQVNPRRSFARRTAQAQAGAPLEAVVNEWKDLRLEVDRKDSALSNQTIDRYHYLGYKPLPGAQLRHFAYAGDRLLGALGFGAAAWKTGRCDAWIGWSPDAARGQRGDV